MLIVMICFGVLTIASAIGVVFSKRSLHSALSLIATMFFIAMHFALLRADVLAVLQVLIYAGAIMVLVVFVIMLLGIDEVVDKKSFAFPRIFALLVSLSFAALILYVTLLQPTLEFATSMSESGNPETIADIGRLLLTDYFFAFQIIALLLLAAIVGAVVLAQEPPRPLAANRGLKAMHVGVEERK